MIVLSSIKHQEFEVSIELFGGDLIRGNVGTLSTSQFISIFIFLIGIGFFITLTKKKMKKDN